MKKVLLAVLVSMFLVGNAYAAKILRFAWDYEPEEAAKITGFKLYENGVAIQEVVNTARTVDTPYVENNQVHIYYLTAFSPVEESGPSETAIIPPYYSPVKKVMSGSFTVEIIEVPQ